MAMKIVCNILDAHSAPILCVAFDGSRNEIYSGGRDCLIKVWDSESGRLLRYQQQHSNWVMDLLFVPSPVKILFSCSLDGNIVVWSDRGRLLQVIEFGGPTFCMAWDSKRRQLFVGGRGAVQSYIVLRSSANYIQTNSERKAVSYLKFLELNYCLCNHDDVVLGICCSDKGKVFTVGMDRALCFFDSDRPDDTIKKVENCHEGGITTIAFDKDGKWLVTGAYDGTVKIWSQEGHCLDSFDKITDCVTSIAYVRATKSYWVSGRHKSVVVIDPLAPAIMTEWVADTSEFHDLILSKVLHCSVRNLVIGISVERKITIWQYDRCAPHRVLHGHTNWVEVVIVSNRRAYKERLLMKDMTDILPERKKFAANKPRQAMSSSASSQLPGDPLGPATNPSTPSEEHKSVGVTPKTATPECTSLASGGSTSHEQMDLSAAEISKLPPMTVAFEPEVFSGGADGSILKWLTHPDPNKDIWMRRNLAPKTNKAITCMLHHTELDILITGTGDHHISIWNMDGSRSVPLWRSAIRQAKGPDILKGHTGKVVGLCALPELVLVSASADKSLRFWDLSTRLPTDVYDFAQDCPFEDMTYSPTREEIATCGGDPDVKIWGGEKRKKVKYQLKGAAGDVTMVRWSASHGGLWITASEQGTICTWSPETQEFLNTLCPLKQPITTLFVDEENDFVVLSYIFDYSIRVHPLGSLGEEICSYKGHTDQVHSIIYLKERHQFISGSWDTTLRVWLAPPKDKMQVEARKLDLQAMMIRQPDGANEHAPQDEFDLAEEMKQYVSNYEKAHPLVLPKVLAEPMNVNILFLQSNDEKEKETTKKVLPSPPPSPSQAIAAGQPSPLSLKIDELEAVFRPSTSPEFLESQPSKPVAPTNL
ncbi:unnamed protein product [Calypogeia fissa]